jgi:uncharacterized protein (DUF697 family)
MTETALSLGREHLAANRRMIIGRSLMAALAGLVPVPVIDDWLTSRVRRGTIRRIAEMRGVDLDDDAVVAIADGQAAPPEWASIAGMSFLVRSLSRGWKKLLVAYVTTQRARQAATNYTIATLFDHYCAKLHLGLGLHASQGVELRRLMASCINEVPGGLATPIFRRSLVAATRATVKAPVELLDIASGGRLRRLLSRSDEVRAVAEIDRAIEDSLREDAGFLARAAHAVEIQLAADHNPYLEQLLVAFERRCRERDADGR